MQTLHALSTQALEPVDLGGQVIGVDVQMHAGGSVTEALHEQPEVLAVQLRSVILGVVKPREGLSDGCLPERELAIMVPGGYIDNNLE